ncbi:MAG: helical backbone metal receptor, partial [Hymenobacteraceae bacterium]|nr:helical backbone metal receptor [Hymenobacteraceae bacterium]MDX5511790.1 helical backbone metal receptor [Hymenobacteraceae bacterium]
MTSCTDQMNRQVSLPQPPQRIVSLVPSQTELLFDLGLDEHIIGVTKFCIHPQEKVQQKTKIGGTKNFNFDKIDALKPDLIIGNKEENYREGIEKLAEKYPVWMSDIFTLNDALEMMQQIGKL